MATPTLVDVPAGTIAPKNLADLPTETNTPKTLLTLPPEMMAQITSYLRPIHVAKLHLTCRALHCLTLKPNPLSETSWCRFHHSFETSARQTKPKIQLNCTRCMQFLDEREYQDSQAKRRCDRMDGRVCIKCGSMEGLYNARYFAYDKQPCFACFGCHEVRLRVDEAVYSAAGPRLPLHVGVGPADRNGKKWCKPCWRIITMYVRAKVV